MFTRTEQHSFPRERPGVQRRPKPLGSFNIDAYEYPPPFLLLTRALQFVAPDFLRHRMIWFALEGSFILFGLFVVARSLGPAAGTRALMLSPLVWASTMTISTLQIGNIQPMVIAAVMVAMVSFIQRRHAGRRGVAGIRHRQQAVSRRVRASICSSVGNGERSRGRRLFPSSC